MFQKSYLSIQSLGETIMSKNKEIGTMISLPVFVEQLKRDLISNKIETTVKAFIIDSVEVELDLTVKMEGEFGFTFMVVTAKSQLAEEKTQKVKLVLKPTVSLEEIREEVRKEGGLAYRELISDIVSLSSNPTVNEADKG
jgi:hypothetical protein